MAEAADEIERLREANAKLMAGIDMLLDWDDHGGGVIEIRKAIQQIRKAVGN